METKEKCKEKREAYKKYKAMGTAKITEVRNETKTLIMHLKEKHWENFLK